MLGSTGNPLDYQFIEKCNSTCDYFKKLSPFNVLSSTQKSKINYSWSLVYTFAKPCSNFASELHVVL